MPIKTTTAKSRTKSTTDHLSYQDMIVDAIVTLKERNGSSRVALKKYIKANNKNVVEGKMFDSLFNRALKSGVEKGLLAQPKGASGGTKLAKKEPKPSSVKPNSIKSSTKTSEGKTAERKTLEKKPTVVKKPIVAKKITPRKLETVGNAKVKAENAKTKSLPKVKKNTSKPVAPIPEIPSVLSRTKSGRVTKSSSAAKKKTPIKKKNMTTVKKVTPKKK